MKLIFIRHGDPDYVHDSLTPDGRIEAEMLSERMCKMQMDEIYVSPLGRAKATAEPTLTKLNRNATEYEWLREFEAKIYRPDGPTDHRLITWDWLPKDWTSYPDFYDFDKWYNHPILQEAGVLEEYERVIGHFENFLKEHGYIRENNLFRVTKANNDTLVFFCHYGVTIIFLSYLLRISPMILWHGLVAAPTSVTTVVTEEREQGQAIFRMCAYGDTSHLYVHDRKPSFAARFCECYDNSDERHTWKN